VKTFNLSHDDFERFLLCVEENIIRLRESGKNAQEEQVYYDYLRDEYGHIYNGEDFDEESPLDQLVAASVDPSVDLNVLADTLFNHEIPKVNDPGLKPEAPCRSLLWH